MILVPTIELRDQKVTDALDAELAVQAENLIQLGFQHLYLIDRDAQYSRRPFNIEQTRAFLQRFPHLPFGVGGGIRTLETVDEILAAGADRVILGPMFWLQGEDHSEIGRSALLREATTRHPGKILAIVDGYHGRVRLHQPNGNTHEEPLLDVTLRLEAEGAAGIVYLEREREGFYGGLDIEIMADIAFALTIPLYVTGGIHALDDLRALKQQAGTGIAGAILGRALLDGRIDPVSALALLRSA